ncbi:MAG: cytosine deaminase [Cyanobacteria bacterium]|nr:cytosine deaminase [Cyanobacteriota bacterium]MDA0864983.1 cytosine deaminase [Cyanobacteriota bacterium]
MATLSAAAWVQIPPGDSFWLTNVRLPLALLDAAVPHRTPIPALAAAPFLEDLVAADVAIRAGRIAAIAPVGTAPADAPQVNLAQGLIWPCFIDLHTHLDKGQTWNRNPNPDGSFEQALATVAKDTHHWHSEDLYQRMNFGLRCSYAHGTRALRTHFDAAGALAATALGVLKMLQQEWAGRLTLQTVCLVTMDYFLTPAGVTLADQVAEVGGVLGGVVFPHPHLEAQLDRAFTLAAERGLDLDLHVDESLNPADQTLRQVAQARIRNGFQGTVVCGHCCALSVQPPAVLNDILDWVKRAELGIVSLPMCNLYLQDRQPQRMPRYRGVTVLHELSQAGIPVAIASDNCRDPFYAYGDHDGLEVFTQSVRIGQLDRPIGNWAQAITTTPATLMGLPGTGSIALDQPADLILFKARTFNELLSRPQGDRVVLRQGCPIDTTLPDYAELDNLVGLAG